MSARYYDPLLGRFMAMDPVEFKEENIHSFNRYAYANNNPYKFVGPDRRSAALVSGGFLLLGTVVVGGYYALPLGQWRQMNDSFWEWWRRSEGAIEGSNDANSKDVKNDGKDTLQPGPHAGESIPARDPGRDFSKEERDKVNEIG